MTVRRLDHLIFATSDLAAAARAWLEAFGLAAEPPYQPDGSHLQLARLPLPAGPALSGVEGTFLELAQPATADHRLARFIADRGEGMFSISIEVDDLDATVAELRARAVDAGDPEPGAWPNTRLARIPRASAHGVAIQLIERL
jgi:catechol 2,3-dioxygenase-like lactoylglutathione lyase family enzyme